MIQLTQMNGKKIWLNPFRITSIQTIATETIVSFGGNDLTPVRELAAEVADKCNSVFAGGDTIQGMIDKIAK